MGRYFVETRVITIRLLRSHENGLDDYLELSIHHLKRTFSINQLLSIICNIKQTFLFSKMLYKFKKKYT